MIKLPEVIIFSTQRSGTHLLLDLLDSHPDINGRGEMFLHYRIGKKITPHVEGKVNVAILHYGHLNEFYELGGSLKEIKIIYLSRNPRNIAISKLQLIADRKIDASIKGHKRVGREYGERGKIDEGLIDIRISEVKKKQKKQRELLRDIKHLQINYEDFVPDEKNIEYLDDNVAKKILDFIGLKHIDKLHTTHIKTRTYKIK